MTRPLVTYAASTGESFDLTGPLNLSTTGGPGWEWGKSSASSPIAEAREMDATLSARTRAQLEGLERLLALAERDAEEGSPGTLSVDGWACRCYLLKGELAALSRFWRSYSVTLYAPEPWWRRETLFMLRPNSVGEVANRWLAYPHDYPHGYGSTLSMDTSIEVPGPLPCDLKLVFYGPAANPRCTVAGNAYGADVEVPEGAMLVIDPSRKRSMNGDSVVLVGRYGSVEDVFGKRVKGQKGSGSYVFEQVPPGTQQVSWPQGYGVDLYAQERRAHLPWT